MPSSSDTAASFFFFWGFIRAASSSSFLVLSQVMDRDILKPTKNTFYLLLGRQICKISEFKLLRKVARNLIKQISIKNKNKGKACASFKASFTCKLIYFYGQCANLMPDNELTFLSG